MQRNTTGQKIQLYAFTASTNVPKTGDAANITAYVQKDGGTVTVLADTSATELDSTKAPGSYQFDLAQAETNGAQLLFTAKSSTSGVYLYPVLIYTDPANSSLMTVDGSGRVDVGQINVGTTATISGDFIVGGDVHFLSNFLTDGIMEVDTFNVNSSCFFTAFSVNSFLNGGTTILGGTVTAVDAANQIFGCQMAANGIVAASFEANAITASALATDAVTEISAGVWDRQTTDLTVAGSIGKALVQFVTGTGGAFNMTITVTDGTNPLQNVVFTIFDVNTLVASGTTNASGNATFSAPAGNFTVNLVKPNYTFASTTRTVTGNQTGTLHNNLVMTPITPIIPPVDPTLQTFYGTLFGLTGPATNVQVNFTLRPVDPARPLTCNGNVVSLATVTATTDGTGTFSIDVIQSILTDDPSFYQIVCEVAQIDLEGVSLGATPVDIATL